jgi:biopolymer transport protein ExbB/TolQ
MSETLLAEIWRRRIAWSRAADKLKTRITYARVAALVLSAAGAVAEMIAATFLSDVPHWRTGFAGLGAVLLGSATYVTARLLTVDAIRAWTRARSVSEAIKAEIYTFCAQANPYTSTDAFDVLLEKTNAVQANARDLERYVAAVETGATTPPPVMSQGEYIAKRVQQQINGYYRTTARRYARRLAVFRGAEFCLGLIGTVLGTLATFMSSQEAVHGTSNTSVSAWVAVVTTLGAALAAHVAANRYDFLVMSYFGTARRLEDLVNKWLSVPADRKSSGAWTEFVSACENAISVENESWLAKWMEKDPSEKT